MIVVLVGKARVLTSAYTDARVRLCQEASVTHSVHHLGLCLIPCHPGEMDKLEAFSSIFQDKNLVEGTEVSYRQLVWARPHRGASAQLACANFFPFLGTGRRSHSASKCILSARRVGFHPRDRPCILRCDAVYRSMARPEVHGSKARSGLANLPACRARRGSHL